MAENKKSPLHLAWWVAPAVIGGLWAAGKISKPAKKAGRTDRANKAELA